MQTTVTSSRPQKPSLADAYLKAGRAYKHLQALKSEVNDFIFGQGKPYSFRGEEDLENALYRIRFELRDPPDSIPLTLGDFLYCLRSSLDQLTWSLAKLSLPYPEGTQFPIFNFPLSTDLRRRFDRYVNGVPADAVRIMESLQPHCGGDTACLRSHLLWRLNLLCNIDKHRRIPVYGIGFEVPDIMMLTAEEVASMQMLYHDDGVTIPLSYKSKVNLNPNISLKVVFGDSKEGIECDIAGAEHIYEFVANSVLPRFARFF